MNDSPRFALAASDRLLTAPAKEHCSGTVFFSPVLNRTLVALLPTSQARASRWAVRAAAPTYG